MDLKEGRAQQIRRLFKYGQLTCARCWSRLLYRSMLSVSSETLRSPKPFFANLLWMPKAFGKSPGVVAVPSKAGLSSAAGSRMFELLAVATQREVSDIQSKVTPRIIFISHFKCQLDTDNSLFTPPNIYNHTPPSLPSPPSWFCTTLLFHAHPIRRSILV